METFIIIIAGVLFSVGTYLLLSRNVLRVIFGTALFTHASHLMLLAVNGLKNGAAPLLWEKTSTYTDPVPQALMLTSIVINFALTAYILVLGYRTHKETGFEDMRQLKGYDHD
jgi:multicomponent Na+:H+ antiporter subunit C